MKAYTDITQSKKLAKILPHGSADMEYLLEHWIDEKTYRHKEGYCEIPVVKVDDDCPLQPITLDCWSLAALLDILSDRASSIDEDADVSLSSYKTVEWWDLSINNSVIEPVTKSDLIDACVEMILKLHERKLI